MTAPCLLKVHKIADVSTRHITAEDGKKISTDPNALAQITGGYGTIFYTSLESAERMEQVGYSAAMVSLVRHAQAHNIPYIRFDSDGDESPHWPTFEW